MEKDEEMAYIGPGSHDIVRDFGSDIHHKMHFGSPYKWKPKEEGPPPGTYDSKVDFTRPKLSAGPFL